MRMLCGIHAGVTQCKEFFQSPNIPVSQHPNPAAGPALGPAWLWGIQPLVTPSRVTSGADTSLWGLLGHYFLWFKAETTDFTPFLGTWNTFLAGRDGAGQDQTPAALEGVCSLFYSCEEQSGIQSRTDPAFIFPARKFSVVYPIEVIISGIRFELGNCDTVTFSCWNYLPGSFDVGSGPAAGLGSDSGVSKLDRGS